MNFIAPILKSLIAGNLKTTVEFTRKQLFCIIVLTIALFFAFVSLSIVLWLILVRFMSPLSIALIFSVFWLVIAIITFIVFKVVSARKRRAYQQQMEEQKTNLMVASALAIIPALRKNKLWIAALPIAGVAALYFFGNGKKKSDDES